MATRQRKYQLRHRAAGLCIKCSRDALSTGSVCLRCSVMELMRKRGLRYIRRTKAKMDKWVEVIAGRRLAILSGTGFVTPSDYATYRQIIHDVWGPLSIGNQRKLEDLLASYDDRALRDSMREKRSEPTAV